MVALCCARFRALWFRREMTRVLASQHVPFLLHFHLTSRLAKGWPFTLQHVLCTFCLRNEFCEEKTTWRSCLRSACENKPSTRIQSQIMSDQYCEKNWKLHIIVSRCIKIYQDIPRPSKLIQDMHWVPVCVATSEFSEDPIEFLCQQLQDFKLKAGVTSSVKPRQGRNQIHSDTMTF